MKPAQIVDALLDEPEGDPLRYMHDLMPFRKAVEHVVRQAGGRIKWETRSNGEQGSYALINYPRGLNFNKVLREHGIHFDGAMGISRGSKTERVQYWFSREKLDGFVQKAQVLKEAADEVPDEHYIGALSVYGVPKSFGMRGPQEGETGYKEYNGGFYTEKGRITVIVYIWWDRYNVVWFVPGPGGVNQQKEARRVPVDKRAMAKMLEDDLYALSHHGDITLGSGVRRKR